MTRSTKTKRLRGFTLIELIVATAIMMILVGAAFHWPSTPSSASASGNSATTSG